MEIVLIAGLMLGDWRAAMASPNPPTIATRTDCGCMQGGKCRCREWLLSCECFSPVWLTDYATALRVSAETKRNLLIVVTTDNCPPCRRLMIALEEVQSRDVVKLKLHSSDAALVKSLGVRAYPMLILASPDTTIMRTHTGYLSASELRRWLQPPPMVQTVPMTAPAWCVGGS